MIQLWNEFLLFFEYSTERQILWILFFFKMAFSEIVPRMVWQMNKKNVMWNLFLLREINFPLSAYEPEVAQICEIYSECLTCTSTVWCLSKSQKSDIAWSHVSSQSLWLNLICPDTAAAGPMLPRLSLRAPRAIWTAGRSWKLIWCKCGFQRFLKLWHAVSLSSGCGMPCPCAAMCPC